MKFVTPQLKLGSVAIIGSSSNLRSRSYAKAIDQHDDVIRFNRAPVVGYEDIVGAKTTLRATNIHVFKNVPIAFQDKNFIKNLRNERILFLGYEALSQNEIDKHTDKSCSVYSYDYTSLEAIKAECGYKQEASPTVGCITIMLCLVSGIKPSLFGFDTDPKDGSRTHYWESRPPPGPCHDVSYEKQFIIDLINKSKVNDRDG